MANIDIQRKETHIWPWILGLLILALLLWFLFARGGDGRTAGGDVAGDSTALGSTGVGAPSGAAGGAGTAADIQPFVAHVGGEPNFAQMGPAHDYTSTGLRLLADALGQVAQADTVGRQPIETRLGVLRQNADAIERDPSSQRHAARVREAFVAAAMTMRAIQEARFPALTDQVNRVESAANNLSANRQLLEQKDTVREFFNRSAEALRGMTGRAS